MSRNRTTKMSLGSPTDLKTSMELLKDVIALGQKMKNNDTAGAQEALLHFSTNLAKANNVSMTQQDLGAISNLLKQGISNLTDSGSMVRGNSSGLGNGSDPGGSWHSETGSSLSGATGTDLGKGSGSLGSLLDRLSSYSTHMGSSNQTDVPASFSSNYTDVGNYTDVDSLPDLSAGLNLEDLFTEDGSEPIFPTHHSMLVLLCRLVMITFIYYIPRTIYFRLTRLGIESKQPTFFLILYLSVVACTGAIAHMIYFHHDVTSNPIVDLLSGSLEPRTMFYPFLLHALTTSLNRTVSPIIALLCLQQLAAFGVVNAPFLNESLVQAALCILSTVVVFGYTFIVENQVLASIDSSDFLAVYPDPFNANVVLDQAVPIVTGLIYLFARQKISRSAIYTTEKTGPEGPCTLDRVSRCVIFQAVMAVIGITAFFFRDAEDHDVSSVMTFLVAGQSPVVFWTLFRSLLRSHKPTRLCFLLCCSTEQKVGAEGAQGIELNAHPQTNEPSQKNEEEEDEDSTQETLDHNKIILMRQSEVEREEEEKKKQNEEVK